MKTRAPAKRRVPVRFSSKSEVKKWYGKRFLRQMRKKKKQKHSHGSVVVVTTSSLAPSSKWQYQDGNWHDYDDTASTILESAFNTWQKSPVVHLFSEPVQSGKWTYAVNFQTMTQRNIKHENHSSRSVRRVHIDVE